jgi:hypothetical protein
MLHQQPWARLASWRSVSCDALVRLYTESDDMLSMLAGKNARSSCLRRVLAYGFMQKSVDKGVLLLRPRAFLMFLVGGADY